MAAAIEERPTVRQARRLPGVEGVWVFILADMTIFVILFGCFMAARRQNLELFEVSRHALNPNVGGLNTLILLTSSWFVVLALAALRHGRRRWSRMFFGLALGCGLAFTMSKVVEYARKIHEGATLLTNDFFMYYFMLTGIHLLHVVAGSVILGVLWHRARTAGPHLTAFESGATFWHMVDLLWVLIFPLLYLVR